VPYAVSPRRGDKERGLVAIHDEAVRARHIVEQTGDLPIWSNAEHATGGIVQAREPLIGEVEVAVGAEEQVVHAFEALDVHALEVRRDFSVHGIEKHDAVLVIRDKDTSIAMELEPVRPTVVLGNQMKDAVARDLEHPPVLDVHAPEIALLSKDDSSRAMACRRLSGDPFVSAVSILQLVRQTRRSSSR
jgi:hypothetical protein